MKNSCTKYEAEIWDVNYGMWLTGFDVFGDYIYASNYEEAFWAGEEWLSFVFSGTRLQSRDRDLNAWFVDDVDVCIAIDDTKYSFSRNYCDMDDVENIKCYICDTDISVYAIDKEGHECALFIVEGDMTEIDSVDDVFGF